MDDPCGSRRECKSGLQCLSIRSARETTLRSAFSDLITAGR